MGIAEQIGARPYIGATPSQHAGSKTVPIVTPAELFAFKGRITALEAQVKILQDSVTQIVTAVTRDASRSSRENVTPVTPSRDAPKASAAERARRYRERKRAAK